MEGDRMTSGDEAGALTESDVRTDSEADAHDAAAPAEPDPGGADTAEPAGSAAADDDGDDAADDDAAVDAGTGSPASAGRWAVAMAVLVVALIAGLVTSGIFWSRAGSANATGNGQQAAIAAGKTAVLDLTTVNYQNPGAWSAKLKPLAVGQFLSVVNNSANGFKEILSQGKVQTTGQIQSVGVEKYSGTTATLAILAYETVKNSQTPQGSERAYRMRVSMVQSGSKWLVSNVEFVQ
jgi:Mce-associated membrane protein